MLGYAVSVAVYSIYYPTHQYLHQFDGTCSQANPITYQSNLTVDDLVTVSLVNLWNVNVKLVAQKFHIRQIQFPRLYSLNYYIANGSKV